MQEGANKFKDDQSPNVTSDEMPSICKNIFLQNESSKFVKNTTLKNNTCNNVTKRNILLKSRESKPNTPNFSRENSSSIQSEPSVANQTRQLISRFDNIKSETKQEVKQKNKQFKSPTKQLISKFNNPTDNSDRKSTGGTSFQFKHQQQFIPNSQIKPKFSPTITQNSRNTSKVHQLVYSLNKTGFLQNDD